MKYKELRKQVKELQDKLNMANSTVAKQIDEISSLNRILSSKQQYLEKALSDFEKHYESQLKVQDNELKRRLTIIHYLEDRLFNKGE